MEWIILAILGGLAGYGVYQGVRLNMTPGAHLAAGKAYRVFLHVPVEADLWNAAQAATAFLQRQGFSYINAVVGAKFPDGWGMSITGTYAGGQGRLVSAQPIVVMDVKPAGFPPLVLSPGHYYAISGLVPSKAATKDLAQTAATSSLSSQGFPTDLVVVSAIQVLSPAPGWEVKCIGKYAGGQGMVAGTQDYLVTKAEEVKPPAVVHTPPITPPAAAPAATPAPPTVAPAAA
jgi:hypothetical protein